MPNEQQELEDQSLSQTNPEAQTTDTDKIEKLIQGALGESERARVAAEQRVRDLEDQLRSNSNSNSTVVNQTVPDVDSNEFFQRPVAIINDLIAQQNKPILELTNQIKREREYNTFKQQHYKSVEGFNAIEGIVDRLMATKQISHANMQQSIREAVGELFLSGALNNNPTAPVAKVEDDTEVIPVNNQRPSAHIRPQARPAAPVEKKTSRRELTEHEKRIIRETPNMTEEKYFRLLEASPRVDDFKDKGKK